MLRARQNTALLTIAALAGGLALRVWMLRYHMLIAGDALVYGDIAKSLVLHHTFGFTDPAGVRPTLIRMPGYPMFLAVCFKLFGIDRYAPALYVQGAADLVTCMLIARTAQMICHGSRRVGLVALWMAALCPFTANYVAVPLTETLSLFFTALVFYGMTQWREKVVIGMPAMNLPLLLIGSGMAGAVLLRPDRALLAVVVIPAMLWIAWEERSPFEESRGTVAAVMLCCAMVVAPLAPWAVRNWRVFHVVQPLAPRTASDPGEFVPRGFARWYRTVGVDFASTQDVYWRFDGDVLDLDEVPARAFDNASQREKTEKLFDDYNVDKLASPAIDARFAELADERVRGHRLRYYVALPLARVANMWLRPRTEFLPVPIEWWKRENGWKVRGFALGYAGLNLVFLAMGMAGLMRALRSEQRTVVVAMMLLVLLRCALLLTVDNSEPRYTLDCYSIVLVLGACVFARREESWD